MTDSRARELPDTRRSETHRVRIEEDGAAHTGGGGGSIAPTASGGAWTVYITVGFFDDGAPGELFITVGKLGTPMRGALDMLAIFVSNALQWGVPLEEVIDKLRGHNFPPHGATSNPEIPECGSIPDYLGRWLELRFGAGQQEKQV